VSVNGKHRDWRLTLARATRSLIEPGEVNTSHELSIPLVVVMAACFLPYINLGPLSVSSQVQPWAAILAWLWVGLKVLRTGLRVSAVQWTLLIFALWFMVYVYAGEGFNLEIYFRRSAAFLLSAGIFLAGQYLTPSTLWRALKLTLPLWLAFALLRYVSSSAYFALVTPLVPTVVNSAARGSSSLAPEATDFGFTMVIMVVLCMITRHRLREEGMAAEKWPLVVAIVSALLSQSGTGYFGLALIGVLYAATRPPGRYGAAGRYLAAALVAVPAYLVLGSLTASGVRGVDLLSTSVQTPGELMDTTFSYRVAHNVVGYLGMLDSDLLGYGAGSFVSEAPAVYARHAVGSILSLNSYYGSAVPATLSQSPVSQFAVIMLEFGIIGVIYVVVLFAFAIRSRVPFKAIAVVILALTWLNSFPVAWPPFWVLIGVLMSPYFHAKTFAGRTDDKGALRSDKLSGTG
jgi:hypothetical protein